ncbi:tetratricopeptide repeat protein [Methylobacterium planeticum]|uniref:Tetratricopeptide repeat protein n=1 Tax=Methylobacterium planeticum TaxID=2615211 RepID=A0A6N6MKF7_9HYPH|nr:hypothetical protein [Methylobacterium planeticum]KAB1070138.1 hypothetical protein F6X51_23495 [Methylobacterium planeticum]
MSLTRILIAVAVVICAVAGYALQSGPEERIAMLIRDGRQAEAVTEIERMLQTGRAKPRVLMQLALLQEGIGNPSRATDMMELYVLARPNDRDALTWLVKAYEASDNAAGLAEALTRLIAVDPAPAYVARLATSHRYAGRYDEERKVLEQAASTGKLEPRLLERLGALLAAEDRIPRALDVLREVDARSVAEAEQPRRLLFELLIGCGLYAEASERAQAWLERWNKPWLATQFTLRLAAKAPPETAQSLAAASAALHPDARLYLAKTLADQGNRRIAATLLAGWPFPDQPLTKVEIEGYVAASVAVGNPGAVWATFARLRTRPVSPEFQAIFAEAMAVQFGLQSIALLQPPLPPGVLRTRPVFAARLAIARGEGSSAGRILAAADLMTMPDPDLEAWLELLLRADTQQGAFAILGSLRQRRLLPSKLMPAYRGLAAQLGHPVGPESVPAGTRRLANNAH